MAISSLAKPRKRVAAELRALEDEFSSFGAVFKSHYDSAVANEMDKLRALYTVRTHRVPAVAIYDAARCYHCVHWFSIFLDSIQSRIRIQIAAVASLFSLILIIGGSLLYILPRPYSATHLNANDQFYSVVVAALLLALGVNIHAKLSAKYVMLAVTIEAAAAFLAVKNFLSWAAYPSLAWKRLVSSLLPVPERLSIKLESVPISPILEHALWFIAGICTIRIVQRLISFGVKTVFTGPNLWYNLPAEQCAEVVIRLLTIANLACRIPDLRPADPYSADSYSDEQQYVNVHTWRRSLNHRLKSLSYFVQRDWQRAMRSYYGQVGKSIAREASRIGFFIEHQQIRSIMLSDMGELREAITSALENAADGNWHLIGAEEAYVNRATMRRRRRIIRRIICISLAIVGAISAPHFLRHYPVSDVQVIVATCLGFAALQVLGLIDPDSSTQLDVAGRLANLFKRGGS